MRRRQTLKEADHTIAVRLACGVPFVVWGTEMATTAESCAKSTLAVRNRVAMESMLVR